MKLLDDRQCDAFQKDHLKVVVGTYGHGPSSLWEVYESLFIDVPGRRQYLGDFATRQKAITAFWRMYYSGWQRPEPVHDGNWALVCIDEYDLSIATYSISERKEFEVFRMEDCLEARTQEHYPTLIRAVEAWIDKYATPEPTAVEILNRIVGMRNPIENGVWIDEHTIDQARAVIEREKGRGRDGDK